MTRLSLVAALAFILGARIGVVHGWRVPVLSELPNLSLYVGAALAVLFAWAIARAWFDEPD